MSDKIVESIAKTDTIPNEEGIRAARVVERAAEIDPVLKNELNEEPWWQSGVGFFGVGGVLWSLGVIFTQVATHGTDISSYDGGVMVTALGALAAQAAVLYRRFAPGLKPMFHGLTKEK